MNCEIPINGLQRSHANSERNGGVTAMISILFAIFLAMICGGCGRTTTERFENGRITYEFGTNSFFAPRLLHGDDQIHKYSVRKLTVDGKVFEDVQGSKPGFRRVPGTNALVFATRKRTEEEECYLYFLDTRRLVNLKPSIFFDFSSFASASAQISPIVSNVMRVTFASGPHTREHGFDVGSGRELWMEKRWLDRNLKTTNQTIMRPQLYNGHGQAVYPLDQ